MNNPAVILRLDKSVCDHGDWQRGNTGKQVVEQAGGNTFEKYKTSKDTCKSIMSKSINMSEVLLEENKTSQTSWDGHCNQTMQ